MAFGNFSYVTLFLLLSLIGHDILTGLLVLEFLCFFKDLFLYYEFHGLPACVPEGQKGAPDLSTNHCEPPRGCGN